MNIILKLIEDIESLENHMQWNGLENNNSNIEKYIFIRLNKTYHLNCSNWLDFHKQLHLLLFKEIYNYDLIKVTNIKEYININKLNDNELKEIDNELYNIYVNEYECNPKYYIHFRNGFSYEYNLDNLNYNIENLINIIHKHYEYKIS